MPVIGPDRGDILQGPVKITDYGTSQAGEKTTLAPALFNPRIRTALPALEFAGPQTTYDLQVPLYDLTNDAHTILVGANSRGRVRVPRAGRLLSVQLIAEDGLALDTTNHLTFTMTNELASGSGTKEMLSTTTGANTTDTDNASAVAITAKTGRAFTVSATAADLNVAEGDHILITATVGGTLANAVDLPIMILRFVTIPYELTPRVTRVLSSPYVGPVDSVANGEITAVIHATTDNGQTVGFDHGDKLSIISTYGPVLQARVKLGTIGANERWILGFASAYTATWTSIAKRALFALEGSMVLKVVCDDATTDTGLVAYSTDGVTLVAGTYYWFTIDMTNPGAVAFQVDDMPPKVLAASALAVTDFLQPVCLVQRASGTGVPSYTMDYFQALNWRRAA